MHYELLSSASARTASATTTGAATSTIVSVTAEAAAATSVPAAPSVTAATEPSPIRVSSGRDQRTIRIWTPVR